MRKACRSRTQRCRPPPEPERPLPPDRPTPPTDRPGDDEREGAAYDEEELEEDELEDDETEDPERPAGLDDP